ncbi:CHC2 zinc finger domain-containing protein [Metapseudomonas lalkuanensis]|nr:CHC2 zinc finger domain-containing protein [Pseudomonas lalkuanensis]
MAQALGITVRQNRAACFNGHDRLTPSLIINKSKNNWTCYGCGSFGDTITLTEKVLGVDFKDACRWLSAKFGITNSIKPLHYLPSPALKKPNDIVKTSTPDSENSADPELYTWLIQHCGKVVDPEGVNYLTKHGISLEVASSFGVVEMRNPTRAYKALEDKWGIDRVRSAGLSSNRRSLLWSGYSILFPFMDDSSVEYLQVRCLSGKRKFIGPVGVGKPIFNHGRIKTMQPGQTLHICEGVPDTLAIEGQGLAAIGILGANSFRTEWVDELLPFNLIGVPDGDSAGDRFRQHLINAFRTRSKSIRFSTPPAGMDACDVIARIDDV